MGRFISPNEIFGKISDSVSRVPRVDSATHALEIIDYEHHEIHSGSSFVAHVDNTTANTDDHRTFLGFECPNTAKWFHVIIEVGSSHPAEAFLVEDVTIDDDEGTEIVTYDRNRNTANTSTILSLQGTPTVGSVTWMLEAELAAATFSYATELEHVQIVAGGGPKAIGGSARGVQEWILKQGLKYGVWVQNIGANTNMHEIHLDFYEHTDKN